jgi:uncharacterized protein (DUF1778 family)
MSEGQGQTPVNINIRAAERQRDLIDQAADQLGRTREGFMLDASCREAEDVLLDKVIFRLDTQAFTQFQAALDNPPAPNEQLRRLMATKAPWE